MPRSDPSHRALAVGDLGAIHSHSPLSPTSYAVPKHKLTSYALPHRSSLSSTFSSLLTQSKKKTPFPHPFPSFIAFTVFHSRTCHLCAGRVVVSCFVSPNLYSPNWDSVPLSSFGLCTQSNRVACSKQPLFCWLNLYSLSSILARARLEYQLHSIEARYQEKSLVQTEITGSNPLNSRKLGITGKYSRVYIRYGES